ncbi:glycoside hydrolase family 127 protein [Pseudochryseolinea flava]|uniref:Glycoside hydrolase family 127 protein n=1 Tax=Pseudochryseolinea flava TaxID=2059302 RepID=A0A364XXU7_9BACT|nr:glycoside hydrolase family 127 protein [Pseudochryseolinea flava]RAV99070.1 glycoside hydrolase family 127 protein [Pseudochryseolinea flava]
MDNKLRNTIFVLFLCLSFSVRAQLKDYPIQGVTFTQVKLDDKFWLPRIETNHKVTIPASFARCEETGRVKNFDMAAAKSGKFCTVYPFDDTDIYKTIEGASFSLSLYPDKKLSQYIDTLIMKVAAAQEPDGYLYTARTINPSAPHEWAGPERWILERDKSHELYNSGHLYEAAVAHFLATGQRNLLDIAIRNADLVCSVFGPGSDKRHVAPGHQVVEMGLVKMYRITGKKEYLATAKYFLEQRGHHPYDAKSNNPWMNGSYWQDHKPVVDQDEAIGHAVRAGYQYAAMADVAALTGDEKFLKAIDAIWNNVVSKKIYVQGGVGALGDGERFGDNYYLPNESAYNETCAAIANVYWNHRMFMLHGDSKYIDILEKSLYNGLISGVGMDGKSFFYTNVLEVKNSSHDQHQESSRSGWFTCSCCPTNITRLIPSVPGYMYAQQGDKLYVNLFASSKSKVTINKKNVEVIQSNNYPWDGDLKFSINPASSLPFSLMIRIPGWAQQQAIPSDLYTFSNPSSSKASLTLNGKPVEYKIEKGYAVLTRTWKKGDVVSVNLPMDVQRVVANANVKDDAGRVAIQRGPLVYCAEWPDNSGRTANIILPQGIALKPELKKDLLNGVVVLTGDAAAVTVDALGTTISTVKQPIVAIPYYAWAHRGKGEMTVWFPEKVTSVDLNSK